MAKKNIGPTMTVDGEAELNRQLDKMTTQLKALQSEMKVVTSAFDENTTAQEKAQAQSEILQKQVDIQRKKVEELTAGMERNTVGLDKDSDAYLIWQQKVNEAQTALNKTTNELKIHQKTIEDSKKATEGSADIYIAISEVTEQYDRKLKTLDLQISAVTSSFDENTTAQEKAAAVNELLLKKVEVQAAKHKDLSAAQKTNYAVIKDNAEELENWKQELLKSETALNKMEAEVKKNTKALSSADTELENVDEELEDASESAEKAEKNFSKFGTGVKAVTGITAAAVGAVGAIISNLENVSEATEEFRIATGKVNTAYEATEKNTTLATEAFQSFYSILGDTGTAAESAQLLASIADNQEDINDWSKITAGALGRFGDALPINGLIESANETAKVGAVTGALADALNWASISEDAFNEKLAALSTEEERTNLITETLLSTYEKSAEAFEKNNESVINARAAQFELQESLSGLSESYLDIKNQLQADFIPSVATAAEGLTMLFEGNKDGADLISEGITEMTATITESAPMIFDIGSSVLTSLLDGIIDAAPALGDGAVDLVITLTEGIVDSLPEVTDSATEIIITLIEGLADSKDILIKGAVEAVLAIVLGLTKPETMASLMSAGGDLVVGIIDGIGDSLPLLIDAAPDIIWNLILGLSGMAIELVGAGGEIVLSVIEGITDSVWQLFETGADIVDDIKDGFDEKVLDAVTWGKDLIDNFIGGIKAKWQALRSTVSDVAQTVKDYIGFSEPDKGPLSNFHTYAPDMMMLFAQGIKENEHLITDQISKSFDLESAISATTGTTSLSNAYNYGGFAINVYAAEGQDPNEIAEAVMYKVQDAIYRKEAAFG